MTTTADTHNRASAAPAVSLDIPLVLDEELDWFFQTVSDYSPDGDGTGLPRNERRPYRRIRSWLTSIPDRDAGVLQTAYLPGPWPIGLREALGRLTGVVVRLAASESGWPKDAGDQDVLDARAAVRLERERERSGHAAFARYVEQAAALLTKAVRSYGRRRDRGLSVVPVVGSRVS